MAADCAGAPRSPFSGCGWWKVRREGQEVSLGCGTLSLIALIVIMFAGRGNDDLKREIEGLRTEVVELRTSIQSLEEAIERGQQPAPAEN